MSKSKRVVFTFDEISFETLKKMVRDGNFKSMADAVRHSLRMYRAIQRQRMNGYTEVILRDPKRQMECTLLLGDE